MTIYHLIGDVHGGTDQLRELLGALGCRQPDPESDPDLWEPPAGEQLVLVGDLVDRGPDILGSLRLVQRLVRAGHALAVLGNHDVRAIALLKAQLGLGERIKLPLGRLMTWVELLGATTGEKEELLAFLEGLPLFLELDQGRLVVVHARWEPRFRQLEGEELVRACAFGRVEGEPKSTMAPVREWKSTEPFLVLPPDEALPARARWARQYQGRALVVWGHQLIKHGAVVQIGRTINVESGCFLGQALSAYSYPEGRVVQVGGATTWKRWIDPYLAAVDTVFPTELDLVADLIRRERLDTAEDYLAWIGLVLEEVGAPPLLPNQNRIHRRIYGRVVEGEGSP